MFSKIFQKAALFGASTVAGVALTGTMMANSAQAATMSYRSEFSVTSNSLDNKVVTGDLSFTKTDLNNGFFSYKLTDFNASFGAFGFNESLTLDDVKTNSNPFLALNKAFVPGKYQTILPSVLAGEDSNYIGDGDFPPEDFTYEFTGQDISDMTDGLSTFVSTFIEESSNYQAKGLLLFVFGPNIDDQATGLLDFAFGEGGTVSFTTTTVPEPATIFALGAVGVGLTATRRRRTNKKIKQKAAV